VIEELVISVWNGRSDEKGSRLHPIIVSPRTISGIGLLPRKASQISLLDFEELADLELKGGLTASGFSCTERWAQ